MKRRRIAVLAGALLVVVVAILCLWLWPRATLTPVPPGYSGLAWSTDFTVAARGSHTISILRVDASGELKKLGCHKVEDARHAYVAQGAGAWYAIGETWQGQELRVYNAGKEEYAVPDGLLRWGVRVIGPAAVLPDGKVVAMYGHPGMGIDPPPSEEMFIRPTAILAREGGDVRRYPLIEDLETCLAVAISGDGSVVAISVAPREPKTLWPPMATEAEGLRTRLFSTKDARLSATIKGLKVGWLSTDGSLALGTRGKALAVYRGTKLVAERPSDHMRLIQTSADGAFAAGVRLRYEAVVMKADTLEDVQRIKLEPPFEVANCDISMTGRPAVLEWFSEEVMPGAHRTTTRLVVYRQDGSVAFRRDFGTSKRVPVKAFQWSRDGKTLHYLDERKSRVVRCPIAD